MPDQAFFIWNSGNQEGSEYFLVPLLYSCVPEFQIHEDQ